MKVKTNNVVKFKKVKDYEELTKREQAEIVNLQIWERVNAIMEDHGKNNSLEGAILIVKTTDGEVQANAFNMVDDEIIATVEEFKQRHYFTKFMGEVYE